MSRANSEALSPSRSRENQILQLAIREAQRGGAWRRHPPNSRRKGPLFASRNEWGKIAVYRSLITVGPIIGPCRERAQELNKPTANGAFPSPPDPDEAAHVLVIDDDDRIRTLLKKYLAEHGYRVTTAPNAAVARDALAGLAFDLLVLDVMMPGESGFDLTEALRETSEVPILLLTARGAPEDRIQGFERGADDYLAKPFEPRELLLRIAALLRRAAPPPTPRGELAFGDIRFNIDRGELRRGDELIRLTASELSLLEALAAAPGEPISRLELCTRTSAALERSIDVQVTRLRKKIEHDPRAPIYLQTVRGVGYILVPDG